jgi:hypothetical protein
MTEIRSYRAVFDLERRIYRVDRLRLNPTGVPVRGVVYALGSIAVVLAGQRLPLLGAALDALPWDLRDLALPVGTAALLSVIRVDGRPFHLAGKALLCYRLAGRRSVGLRRVRGGLAGHSLSGADPGGRWWPSEILLVPDGSDATLRRLRYTGPGAVLVTVAHEHHGSGGRFAVGRRRARVRLRGRPDAGVEGQDGGAVIALAPGASLDVGVSRR